MSKFVGTGPLSYKKRIYQATVSQRLRNTGLDYMAYGIKGRWNGSENGPLVE